MLNNNQTIFKNEEWEIKPMITQKGKICICVYFRGIHMGFCNVGDFKTQELFISFAFPHLIEKQKEILGRNK